MLTVHGEYSPTAWSVYDRRPSDPTDATDSIFVQAAEGTSYGIVPFMNPKQLAIISACVGDR